MSTTAQEQAASILTESLLSEAMEQGFAVNKDTEEHMANRNAPETPQEAPSGPPAVSPANAVESIVANLAAQTGVEEVPEAMEEEYEEEEELQLPDFEAEAERQLLDEEIAEAGTEYEPEGEVEEFNPADRKRAIIAERKAAYYENLTAQRARGQWEKEALKHFPYAKHAIPNIKATSRRSFLKSAKDAHEAVKPYIVQATEMRVSELEAEREKLKAEVREEAEAAWGKPHAGPGAPSVGGPGSAFEAELRAARKSGDLAKVIALQMTAAQGGEEE